MADYIEKWQLAEIGFVDEEIDFLHWYSWEKSQDEKKTNRMISVFIQDEMEKVPAPGRFKTHKGPLRDNYVDLRNDFAADTEHFPNLSSDSVLKPSSLYTRTLFGLKFQRAYFEELSS